MTFVIVYFVIVGSFLLLTGVMGFRAHQQQHGLTEDKCLAIFNSEDWKTVEELKLGLERQIGRPVGYVATDAILLRLRRKGLIAWMFRQDGVSPSAFRGINRIYQFRLAPRRVA